MLTKISSHIRVLCGLAMAGMAVLGALLAWTVVQQRESAALVERVQQIQLAIVALTGDLADLEAGEREFIVTGEERYLEPYNAALGKLPASIAALKNLVHDNPAQAQRAERLEQVVADRMKIAVSLIAERKSSGAAMRAGIDLNSGNALMENIRRLDAGINALEHDLVVKRQAAIAASQWQMLLFPLLGGPLLAVLLLLVARRSLHGINDPLGRIIEGTQRLTNGEFGQEIVVPPESEFGALAQAFNTMAHHLTAEQKQRSNVGAELRQTYKQLSLRTSEVEARGRTIDLLGRMAHRLQSCRNEEELSEMVRRFAALILPGIPGALFLLNNSRNVLRAAARWNDPTSTGVEFGPEDCWALRRGQAHIFGTDEAEVICAHVEATAGAGYRCFPMMAQGETLGLLYVEEPPAGENEEQKAVRATLADPHRIEIMVENIALALGNLRLRDALRSQSIRDPLTGLFNRRYLEESFNLEVIRAARTKAPISVLMVDVDHFKKFNDTFGHEAGDVVLKAVGETLAANVRRGDIACRYGGEEFTVVAPGASLEDAAKRAECVRVALAAINLVHQGRALGPITCSIGVASHPAHGTVPADIIRAADEALYRAKQNGRNRVEQAPPPLPTLVTLVSQSA
jgi:diguanylate cyclase (GGDEF)-like protein